MGSLGMTEILIILAVVLLLFGSAKLPELSRSLGRSMRIFKSEVKEMKKDDEAAPTQARAEIVDAPDAPAANTGEAVVDATVEDERPRDKA